MLCYKRRIPIPELEARIEVSGIHVATFKSPSRKLLATECTNIEIVSCSAEKTFPTEKTFNKCFVACCLGFYKIKIRKGFKMGL